MDIFVNVVNQKLKIATNLKNFVSGTQEFIRFVFNMGEDWDGLTTFAQFMQNGIAYNQYLDAEQSTFLPSEIGAGTCTLMLYGSNGNTIATTNYLTLTIDQNILVSDAQSTDISLSLYNQLVSKVNALSTLSEQTAADLAAADKSLQQQLNTKADEADLAAEVSRAKAAEKVNADAIAIKANQSEVDELTLKVTQLENNEVVAELIAQSVESEMERYLSSGKLANMTIEDGSITRDKVDQAFEQTLANADSAMQPDTYDPQNLHIDVYAYAKAKADTVQRNLDEVKEELQDGYELTDTVKYTKIGDAIRGAVTLAQTYAQALLADYKAFTIKIVDALPLVGESMTFYLVPNKSQTGYDKYWWVTDDNGESRWDIFGSATTLVVTELPEVGDEDTDYILKTKGGCLYYKYIDGVWEVVAGSLAAISSVLPDVDQANEFTDYYVLGENGRYVHYRFINGAFHTVGADAYTKQEIDTRFSVLEDNIAADKTAISQRVSTVESTVAEIQAGLSKYDSAVSDITKTETGFTVNYIDGGSKTVEIDTGSDIGGWYIDEDGYLHLQDKEDRDIIDPVLLPKGGGGGETSSGSATITRITPSTTECIYQDNINIEFTFNAVDASGDMVGDGTATWSVGGVTKATSIAHQGQNSFNIGPYLSSGTNNVKVSISVDTGGETNTVVTKTWSVNAVNMYFVWNYDNAQINTSSITDRWTPYGDVSKTTHTKLDGTELNTNTTTRSGVQQTMLIEMQTHGAHMVERWMTATVGGREIKTASQFHDMIFVEAGNMAPIISCSYDGRDVTQYNTVALPVVIYDPAGLTTNATLSVDGVQVAEWKNIDRSVHYWNYSPSSAGAKELTITCGDTTKTITVNVVELSLDVEEVGGYAFKFKSSEFATNEAVQAWESNGVNMTFSENFDWINGGLQTETDDSGNIRQYFCVKAGTTATINYELFADDAKRNGKNFKFIYKAVNCRNYDAQVLSCYDSNIGLRMYAQNALLTTEQNTLETLYCKDTYMEFEFNIHPNSEFRYLQFWMDGSHDRNIIYAENDNMTQPSAQNIVIGSDDCDVYVYLVKAYDHHLTNENECDNFIVDAPNAFEMVSRHDRNDILNESGEISYEKLAQKNPDLRVFLFDMPRMTNGKKDTVTGCSVRQIWTNGGAAHCWNANNVEIKGQGTSSEHYGDSARNMDCKFTTGFQLDNGSHVDDYSMSDGAVGVNYMNFKLNVASSENCNNACLADWYNTYQPYLSPARQKNPNCRDTMEFHAGAVFIRDQSGELFGDTEYHLYGICDAGNSKKNTKVFHDTANAKACCIEVLNNTNLQCLMHSKDFSNEKYDGDGSFEFRYPDNPTDEMKQAWQEFISFMADNNPNAATNTKLPEKKVFQPYTFKGTGSDNDVLAGLTIDTYAGEYENDTKEYRMANLLEHCEEHMIMDSVMFHYVFIESFAMVDNAVKNTFWSSDDLVHWELTKDYDNDTALGNDNEGGMTIPYGTETDDPKGDGHAYNGWDATWFEFCRGLYAARQRMYINRESAGCWNTDAFMKKTNDYQALRPERLWVMDTQRKYLRPYETAGTTSYIPMLNGKKTHQRQQVKYYNELYFSSCYIGATCTSQLITVRCYTPDDWKGVEPKNEISLTMYANCYIVVRAASTTKRIRATRGQEYTIKFDEAGKLNDTETYFYLAPMIQKIGDMSHLYIGYCNFAYATLLQEISIGSSNAEYKNNNLKDIDFGNNTMLEYLQIQNCPNVTSSLDLRGCQALKTLLLEGSGFTGVAIAQGALAETLHLPSPASLSLRELHYLKDFTIESKDNLTTLRLEGCDTIDSMDLVNTSPNINRIRITQINWILPDTTLLDRLIKLAGLDENDYNTDISVLTGTAHIPVMRQQKLNQYKQAWSNLTVTYDSMVTQYAVSFVNYDDTPLHWKNSGDEYVQYVDRGERPYDPIEAGEIDKPTRAANEQFTFEFSNWDGIDETVLSPKSIRAMYDETIRTYTVRWYQQAGIQLKSKTAEYGSSVVYDDELPTLTDEEGSYVYKLFKGWDKSTGFITGDIDVYAQWDRAELPPPGKDLKDMSAPEIYGVATSGRANSYFEQKDYFDIQLGHDFDFVNVESEVIAENKYFDGKTAEDTKIKLFGADSKSFTLAIDFQFANTEANNTLLSCYEEDGSEGFRFRYSSRPNIQWGDKSFDVGYQKYRDIVVLRHKKGDNKLYIYCSNGTEGTNLADSITTMELVRIRDTSTEMVLTLGATKFPQGGYDDYAKGFIHWCKIWYDDLGEDNAKQLAAWCHETLRMEYCGAERYRVSGGSSQRCNVSFIANNLLDGRGQRMNTTNTNKGGWEDSLMRTFCNERIFNALPVWWQSIIKTVRIIASAGERSSEILYSDDKVYIPCLTEMNNNQSEPYVNEGTHIPYFTGNPNRVKFRGHIVPDTVTFYNGAEDPTTLDGNSVHYGDVWNKSNGTGYILASKDEIEKYNLTPDFTTASGDGWFPARYWWLRSPYAGDSTNFWYVSINGYLYSNTDAYVSYGVCPCFSI